MREPGQDTASSRLDCASAFGHLRGTLAYAMDSPVRDPNAGEYYALSDRIEDPTDEEREAFRAAYRSAIEAAEIDSAGAHQATVVKRIVKTSRIKKGIVRVAAYALHCPHCGGQDLRSYSEACGPRPAAIRCVDCGGEYFAPIERIYQMFADSSEKIATARSRKDGGSHA